MVKLDKKYRVLLVHNFYQKPGGEDTVFYNEKKLLEDNGHKVITYTRDNKEILNQSVFKKLLLPFVAIFNFKTYFDVKRTIKDNEIDIVHVHNTLSLVSPSVFYAAISMKVPVVQTLHNFRMQCPNGLFYRDDHICEDCVNKGLICALKHNCYRDNFLQTFAIVLMTKIHRLTGIFKRVNFICLTEFNKNKLLQINNKNQIIDENRVFVKPNFVFYEPINNSNDYKVKNDNGKGYYLYVGRLDKIKGIDIVLEAFSKMPDKELHVIGSGGEEYINKYSKNENIKFLRQLSHEDVLREMQKGKALIYSTRLYEGQPISIIESYMCREPVISSNIGNAYEMVKEGITGFHFEKEGEKSLINIINKYDNLSMDKVYIMQEDVLSEYNIKYDYNIGYKYFMALYSIISSSMYKDN